MNFRLRPWKDLRWGLIWIIVGVLLAILGVTRNEAKLVCVLVGLTAFAIIGVKKLSASNKSTSLLANPLDQKPLRILIGLIIVAFAIWTAWKLYAN